MYVNKRTKLYVQKVRPTQGLLELLWMVYSEGKLQPCLKLRNFQNPINKDSFPCIRHTMHKKGLTLALVVELAKLNFDYITILKQHKFGLGLVIDQSTFPSI